MLRGRRCRPLRPLRLRSIAPMGSRSLRLRSRAGEERRAAGTPQIARAHAGRGPRNVPQAPFAAPGLSPWRAGTLGINSPSRPPWLTSPPHSGGHAPLPRRRCKIWIPLHGIILPASRVGEPRPPALPPGPCRAAPRSLPAMPRGRRAAPRSLLPRAGRALRRSRARGEGRGPQRPRPVSRSSRAISRASAIATRMPRSVNLITRPVARFTAKPSAAPLILRTRPSALER